MTTLTIPYICKRFQIQNGNLETMVVKWFLHISNHQNEILLQVKGKILPVGFIETISYFDFPWLIFQNSSTRKGSKHSLQLQSKAERCRSQYVSDADKGKEISFQVLYCSKNWLLVLLNYQIQLKDGACHENHTAN